MISGSKITSVLALLEKPEYIAYPLAYSTS